MKIIAIIDNAIGVGGGFDQSLNAILQMKRVCKDRFEFEIFTTRRDNIPYLEKLGIQCVHFSYSVIDQLLARLGMNTWWQILQRRIKYIGPLEKKLFKHKCDLVYFVTPSSKSAALQKLNYIATVWDLCHRDAPEFPEVRNFNEFQMRERLYKNSIAPALLVLADSEQLVDRATQYYGIDRDRFLVMPFAPSPLLDQGQTNSKDNVLKKYDLEEDYFYYPAQFWAHKNHIRILQSLLILDREKDWKPTVVFTGKDYGNLNYIKMFTEANGLSCQVKILGFVPPEDLRGLYEAALAVVMPTYFGPTNIPPLEAWSLGKPLIYSAHLMEQAGDAALLVNPDDADDVAKAMYACKDTKKQTYLIDAGANRLIMIDMQRKLAEDKLYSELEKFSVRRMCWK